jgi:hypothetical protein
VPLRANVDRRLAGTLRLVIVLPAETTATAATATTVVVEAILATATTSTLEATTSTTALKLTTPLTTTATENGATATAESTLGGGASVVDNGKRGLVFGTLDSEQAGSTGTVDLLICI